MNNYSLKALHKDPIFWVLFFLSIPTIVGIVAGVIALDVESETVGLESLLATPLALYLGLGLQLPRAQSIKAASVQERAMIDNDHIRIDDPDLDEAIEKLLEGENDE